MPPRFEKPRSYVKYAHMKNTIIAAMILMSISWGVSQERVKEETKQGWTTEIAIGADVISNLLLNPVTGSGESRIGFGAALGVDTHYNNGKFGWRFDGDAEFGIQKTGSGTLEDYPDEKVPFKKNIDRLRLYTKAALQTSYFSKFYYSSELFFSSQMSPTYEDGYTSDVTKKGAPMSEFLSPAVLQIGFGMEYRPNDYWSVFLSPASFKTNMVLNDNLADDVAINNDGKILGSIYGNPLEVLDDGTIIYNNFKNQFGATFRFMYENAMFHDFLTVNTNLSLFADYLDRVDHIDVNWRNEIGLTIFKGLQLSLLGVLTYDHDIFVQISDPDSPKGVNGVGRRVSYNQQMSLKYSFTLDSKK